MMRDIALRVLRRNRRLVALNAALAGFNVAGCIYASLEGNEILALVTAAVALVSGFATYWVDRASRALEGALGPPGNGWGPSW